MSCTDFRNAWTTWAGGLEASTHPNITIPSGGGGSTGGAQSDQGTLGLRPATYNGGTNTFSYPSIGQMPIEVSTVYLGGNGPAWQEDWIFRAFANHFDQVPGWQAWIQVSGDPMSQQAKNAICNEQGSGAYRLAVMPFDYRRIPSTNTSPTTSPGQSCTLSRKLFHLWTVTSDQRQGSHPTGALLRLKLTGGGTTSWMDLWLLKGNYLPPSGTRKLAFEALDTNLNPRPFLQEYWYNGDSGPLGSRGTLADARLVLIAYTDVAFCS